MKQHSTQYDTEEMKSTKIRSLSEQAVKGAGKTRPLPPQLSPALESVIMEN